MKNLVLVTVVSVLSALISVSAYKYFEEPQNVIIREQVPVRYANFAEDQNNIPNTQRSFLSSAPTNFTTAAEVVTPGVVNIKATSGADLGLVEQRIWRIIRFRCYHFS